MIWRLISAPIHHQVNWTEEEQASFELFIRSSCGMKLFELLRQVVATKTFNAVCQDDSLRANAEARGAQEILALLHRLRNLPPGTGEQYAALGEEPTMPPEVAALDRRVYGWSGGSSAI